VQSISRHSAFPIRSNSRSTMRRPVLVTASVLPIFILEACQFLFCQQRTRMSEGSASLGHHLYAGLSADSGDRSSGVIVFARRGEKCWRRITPKVDASPKRRLSLLLAIFISFAQQSRLLLWRFFPCRQIRCAPAYPWATARARWLGETLKRTKEKDEIIPTWFDEELLGRSRSSNRSRGHRRVARPQA
jgi:hypothetical protein